MRPADPLCPIRSRVVGTVGHRDSKTRKACGILAPLSGNILVRLDSEPGLEIKVRSVIEDFYQSIHPFQYDFFKFCMENCIYECGLRKNITLHIVARFIKCSKNLFSLKCKALKNTR